MADVASSSQVMATSRGLAEYRAMFSLRDDDLAGRVVAARRLVDSHPGQNSWRWYGSPDAPEQLRAEAAQEFLTDLTAHPGRYLAAALPELPFADQSFRLALCSYLLFTWADRLDEAWHLAAVTELARVAAQVRIYPLVTAGRGAPVPFLDHLVQTLRAWRLLGDDATG